MNEAAIRSGIATILETKVLPSPPRRVEGGSINECFRFEISTGSIFVKVAPVAAFDRLQAEAAGLEELRGARAIRVPEVRGMGCADEYALLILEWLKLGTSGVSEAALGKQLAAQHRVTKPLFGFKRHNFIGATPQINFWSRNWLNFWREHRLEAQIDRADKKGADDEFIERAVLLTSLIDGFFVSYVPVASLLHGDLWSGNVAVDSTGAPVTFDPAVYYGDRECDLAMTRLFGGFGPDFYAAYAEAWPPDENWQLRSELYNLYHVLNHYNLFGGHYLGNARNMVEKLLAEVGH